MTLQLTKIEGGLCSGEVMFSEYGMFIYPCKFYLFRENQGKQEKNNNLSRKRRGSLLKCLYPTSIFIQLFCYLSGDGGNKKKPGNEEGIEKEDGENDRQMEDSDEGDEAGNEEDMEESEED